ncbi:MAG: peptidase M10 [Ferruginibacter sp.]|nr:peptidase M10 [Bacteroidota bacterium]MBX2919979.1 peptidase M10 [Ferruginibacter sp.]MCB0708830.1 peptidase M10 [Chitinophagaceae bacterium]
MGEAELRFNDSQLILHASIIIYGEAANDALAIQIAKDIEDLWNEADGKVIIRQNWFTKKSYSVRFNIEGRFDPNLTPQTVFENTNPRNNYFRIEEYANGNISYVDGINSNTGYFKLQNLLDNSSTAAHEFGHTIGLDHPQNLDIRGQGTPGIMYPRGTIVDPQFQYYPDVAPGEKGGTLNPFTRKVLQKDIDDLKLNSLNFDDKGFAVLGGFSSVWHDKHIPQ